ncbi:hypothetical protein K435DRAFT_851463 [Dendrothele bispora CBS 962.96]|uniref:GST N-terminal domain-containing protein n=1 Tax=Dendrothele bispora (strain CBS 962.96) TaxID=1314807 RepID=A0A4S8MM76_DENBC|nr:hypothetical protein K435DRAFT_851463 [Dendrothele bispora CBS 962.96]
MANNNVITFFDIPCKFPGVAWNGFTWRSMYSLNYKGVPYKTVWLEYSEIEPTLRKFGINPTGTKPDGSPLYTLPAIYDPSTKTGVAESFAIAEYLDKTYPDKPTLVPTGTGPLINVFTEYITSKISATFFPFAVPMSHATLNAVSQPYFRRTREAAFGKTMEDMLPQGEAKVKEWEKFKQGLGDIDRVLRTGKGPFVLGEKPSFADCNLASIFVWIKVLFGEDSEEWKGLTTSFDGRFGEWTKEMKKYESVV